MRCMQLFSLCMAVLFSAASCKQTQHTGTQPVHEDKPFIQDFSVKYNIADTAGILKQVCADRNGTIQVFSSKGLLKPFHGELLYAGNLVPDTKYRTLTDKHIQGLTRYQDQFVYVDDKAVLSNAWAGNIYDHHTLPGAYLVTGGDDFAFLISDGHALQLLQHDAILWTGHTPYECTDILFDPARKAFWLLGEEAISVLSLTDHQLSDVITGTGFTCMTFTPDANTLIVGTHDGYNTYDARTGKQKGTTYRALPCTDITAAMMLGNALWMGTTQGAFAIQPDSTIHYYASQRWLPSDTVTAIAPGPDASVLVLCTQGLAQIHFKPMTLYDKALYYEQQVRTRHIRNGFNATLGHMENGSLATGFLKDADNDGLWTSMYLGAEVFRYTVTKSPEALQNIRESMDAMERLFTINKVKGFPSRSFERRGYKVADQEAWRRTDDPEWDWKSTTSSDEAIGHMFVYGVMAELLTDQPDLKARAITLMDSLMQHIVAHDLYLVDWNGEPTLWGRWNPDYVNGFPEMIGDRKVNSSNLIGMLQTAYHFTGKEMYKDKAFELMTQYGYFKNLMRPMKDIGMAPDEADAWSKRLSSGWNHSDDEMYFLGYWGLYRYAFNDTLKAHYKEAILDHWQIERPEKEGAWNIFTAMTGTPEFDLNEAVWYLQEYPLDLIEWRVENSHRKDIDTLALNFRGQATAVVLPPDELPIRRHNSNRFILDGGGPGREELSAGDIWLLPYWMGRYLQVISAPEHQPAPRPGDSIDPQP